MAHHDIRFIAEWEPQKGILLALPEPHTDWNYILEEAREQYRRLIKALCDHGNRCLVACADKESAEELLKDCDQQFLYLFEARYNDTWTRDYGPISVIRGERFRSLDFGFNGWGLKFVADKDNLMNLQMRDQLLILPDAYRNERSFILEGGSVESDGKGTVLTTSRCLLSPNRNGGKTKKEIDVILGERLGTDHVLWLDYGALSGDDTDSHIDTLCRIAPNDTILFTGCRDMDDSHFEELLKMRAQLSMFRNASGEAYNLVELPLPDPIYDEDGMRLPASYANYLITNKEIFMPVYGQPHNDMLACQTVRIVFPDREIVPVDCTTLIKQHGSLHCATMQLH